MKNILPMLKRVHEVGEKVLVLADGLPNLGLFNLSDYIGMEVAYTTLILSLRKVIYSGKLQWDITINFPISCRKLYDTVYGGRCRTFFQRIRGNW